MEQATRRAVLAGLAAAGAWPRMAGAAGPIDVPVALTPTRVTVQVSFDGRGPYGFLLDSGGAASLIDPALAREVGMRRVESASLGLGNVNRAYDVVEYPSMLVGGAFRTGPVRFAATDIHYGEGLRGTLDAGFLTAYPSELLLDEGRWRLYDRHLPDRPAAARLPRALETPPRGFAPHLFADVALGSGRVRLLLDTGAPRAMRLTPAGARRAGLSVDGRPSVEERRADGTVFGRSIRVDQVTVGGIALPRPVVTLDLTADTSGSADGWMGLRLLRLLNLAFDPATRDLLVWRNRNAPLPDTGPYAAL